MVCVDVYVLFWGMGCGEGSAEKVVFDIDSKIMNFLLRLPQAWHDIGIRFSIRLSIHTSCCTCLRHDMI